MGCHRQRQNLQKKRRCWCKRSCGKLLSRAARQQHYAQVAKLGRAYQIAPSESPYPGSGSDEEMLQPATGEISPMKHLYWCNSCNKATRTDSNRILIDAEDLAGHHSDSESSTSFYSARNSELSDSEASDDDEPLEQAYDTEPEILDDDWGLLDDYMFEEELFSTRTFDET